MTTFGDRPIELSKRFLEAFLEGDAETIEPLLAPEVAVFRNVEPAAERRIPAAQLAAGRATEVKVIASVLPTATFTVDKCIVGDEGFVFTMRFVGSLPDGTAFDTPAALVFTVADGRVSRMEEYLSPTPGLMEVFAEHFREAMPAQS